MALSTSALAVVVCATLALLLAVLFIICCLCRRANNKRRVHNQQSHTPIHKSKPERTIPNLSSSSQKEVHLEAGQLPLDNVNDINTNVSEQSESSEAPTLHNSQTNSICTDRDSDLPEHNLHFEEGVGDVPLGHSTPSISPVPSDHLIIQMAQVHQHHTHDGQSPTVTMDDTRSFVTEHNPLESAESSVSGQMVCATPLPDPAQIFIELLYLESMSELLVTIRGGKHLPSHRALYIRTTVHNRLEPDSAPLEQCSDPASCSSTPRWYSHMSFAQVLRAQLPALHIQVQVLDMDDVLVGQVQLSAQSPQTTAREQFRGLLQSDTIVSAWHDIALITSCSNSVCI